MTAIEFAADEAPGLRRAGLWALGFVAEAQDADRLATATPGDDPEIRSVAIGSIPNPAALGTPSAQSADRQRSTRC